MKTIVISAVNIRKGGTLTILRNCLQYLSTVSDHYRVIAVVHKKDLANYPGIEYIEIPWALKSWWRRLWCEYVTMYNISKQLSPVYLWFSLHDTTPRVVAERRAVYLQTSFPFFKWRFRDVLFDYKIPVFAILIKFAYRINIKRNRHLVVQQQWLREGFSKMFKIDQSKFIVARPLEETLLRDSNSPKDFYCSRFLYVSTADCHKNFELVCEAAEMLEKEIGVGKFTVSITISGTENRYSEWLLKKWKDVNSIEFAGFLDKKNLNEYYEKSDCLIFPSRIETWGLPISEFKQYDKPMLLADCPYAHETAVGSEYTAFFDPDSATMLKNMMKKLVSGQSEFLKPIPMRELTPPTTKSWDELFKFLINN